MQTALMPHIVAKLAKDKGSDAVGRSLNPT